MQQVNNSNSEENPHKDFFGMGNLEALIHDNTPEHADAIVKGLKIIITNALINFSEKLQVDDLGEEALMAYLKKNSFASLKEDLSDLVAPLGSR